MTKHQKKFGAAIKFLKEFTANDGEADRHVPLILRDDETLVSAESTYSFMFADYYGEFRGGYPWINPELEAGLKKLGCFLEWQNPGCLSLYD